MFLLKHFCFKNKTRNQKTSAVLDGYMILSVIIDMSIIIVKPLCLEITKPRTQKLLNFYLN